MWWKIVVVLIAILFVITLIIKRFAYFRPSYAFTAPRENFVDIQEGNLHAWYRQGTSGLVILFCHGNAGNLSHRQTKLIELLKMGHSILIFDYSGYGRSRGVPDEQLCYANADTFVQFLLRQGYKRDKIIPYGESMGAAVAAYAAMKYQSPGVIIESGLPSIAILLRYWHKILGLFAPIFTEFNTISYLRRYSGKVLVLHSTQDEIVPYETASDLRALSTQYIDMTGLHNNPNIPWDGVKDFLAQL